jgi:hypothetical protein
VVFWRGRKLALEKEAGAPFGRGGLRLLNGGEESTDVRGEVMLELQLFTA